MSEAIDYSHFFDMSRDLFCVAGADGFFRRVNPAFTRELGWSEADLLTRPFFDYVHPDDLESTQAEIENLADGLPTLSFSNRYRCKDGTLRRLHWLAFFDRGKGLIYAIARVDGA